MAKKTEFCDTHTGRSGVPMPTFIVTRGDVPDGIWGEGYVIHTMQPFCIGRWGYCGQLEGNAMSAAFPVNDEITLAVLIDERQPNFSGDEYSDIGPLSLSSVIHFLADQNK